MPVAPFGRRHSRLLSPNPLSLPGLRNAGELPRSWVSEAAGPVRSPRQRAPVPGLPTGHSARETGPNVPVADRSGPNGSCRSRRGVGSSTQVNGQAASRKRRSHAVQTRGRARGPRRVRVGAHTRGSTASRGNRPGHELDRRAGAGRARGRRRAGPGQRRIGGPRVREPVRRLRVPRVRDRRREPVP